MTRTVADIEDTALTAVRRAIAAAVKVERQRCWELAAEAARERREAGDPEGADAMWDLSQAITRPTP